MSNIHILSNPRPWQPILNNLVDALDHAIRTKTKDHPDEELRAANLAILQKSLWKNPKYEKHVKAMIDEAQSINEKEGVITDSAVSTTGDFAQVALVSQAMMIQAWQDLNFLQLVMTEEFGGSTYKVPLEFQSDDLFSLDDFVVGEMEPIETEGVHTYTMEFGSDWIKRGTILSKEAIHQLNSGPLHYDVLARNLANLTIRFKRYIDQRLSTEMLQSSDEYQAQRVTGESVRATEMQQANQGVNVPIGSNVIWVVDLLCGRTSGALSPQVPPVVRPRDKKWLDTYGRLQDEVINDVVTKVATTTLARGTWNSITGVITDGDYAVDFENAKMYFTSSASINNTDKRPTVDYSYATNIVFFDLTVPDALKDNPARYLNRLIELLDLQVAYMGSAPRYMKPDFCIGSLAAMKYIREAELFYKWASPDGTKLLQGKMWMANRWGLEFGQINAPWEAGDQRLLLGRLNSTRLGIGSPFEMEGPEPVFVNGKITSARQYYATQQISVGTPVVLDRQGNAMYPPYRSIKLFKS